MVPVLNETGSLMAYLLYPNPAGVLQEYYPHMSIPVPFSEQSRPFSLQRNIHSGTTPNILEVRIQGAQLSFYINGQYLTRITDTENFRRGRAGVYTSDSHEVAFDDLSITH